MVGGAQSNGVAGYKVINLPLSCRARRPDDEVDVCCPIRELDANGVLARYELSECLWSGRCVNLPR